MSSQNSNNVIDIFTGEEIDPHSNESDLESALFEEIDLAIADEQIHDEMLSSKASIFEHIDTAMEDDEFRAKFLTYDEEVSDTETVEILNLADIVRVLPEVKICKQPLPASGASVYSFQKILDLNEDSKKRIARNRLEFQRIINDFYVAAKNK